MFKRGFAWLMVLTVMMLASCASVPSEPAAVIPVAKNNLTFIHFFSDECPNCLVMIPVVDKLAAHYSQQMTFETLNVETDGKDLFDSLGLHGQPIFVIMKTDGTVVYKGFGRVPELALDGAIRKAIGV